MSNIFIPSTILKQAKGIRLGQDVLEDKKLLRFIFAKTENRFVISLDSDYILHHWNAKKSLHIYSHDVIGCMHLRGDRI